MTRMASWAVTVGHWRRVPIRLHASVPLGLYVLSGFQFNPLWWLCTLVLILLHELGHAFVVQLVGGRATEVMLTGFGGHCAWVGDVTPLGRAAIACGGLAAQLVLMLIALAVWGLGHWPEGEVANVVLYSATLRNAYLFAFNALPLSPLDGAEGWQFPYLLGQRLRTRLGTYRNVMHAEGDFIAPGQGGADAQAKAMAAQLLADARREEEPK